MLWIVKVNTIFNNEVNVKRKAVNWKGPAYIKARNLKYLFHSSVLPLLVRALSTD
jgi:hypothetical protein